MGKLTTHVLDTLDRAGHGVAIELYGTAAGARLLLLRRRRMPTAKAATRRCSTTSCSPASMNSISSATISQGRAPVLLQSRFLDVVTLESASASPFQCAYHVPLLASCLTAYSTYRGS